MDTSAEKPSVPEAEAPFFVLPPDLVPVVVSWSSIPEQIKAAVQAVLAPYLTGDGRSADGG